MRLLLDTQILLAFAGEQLARVPRVLRDAMATNEAALHVSVASLWEIAIKTRVGKLQLGIAPKAFPALVERLHMVLLLIDEHHVLADLDPEPPTRDPFDRLLLAQCAVENLRLVTLDRALVDHPLAYRPR